MTIDERIEKLEKIVAESRARRAEVEDQLERHDIRADELVDFRIQISAQLSVLDQTLQRLKRRLRDLKLIRDLKTKIKELTASQITTISESLNAVQTAIKVTATLKDVITVAQKVAKAATKASEAAAPTPV